MPDKRHTLNTEIPMNENDNGDAPAAEHSIDSTEDTTPHEWNHAESVATVTTDDWVQIHQAHYDREGEEELVTTLMEAIAEAINADPLDPSQMPPLYESVDAQALEETFFGPMGAGTRRDEGGAVTFHYNGYKVALRIDGWIFIYEAE